MEQSIYYKIKNTAFTLIFLLLWLHFVFMIGDPTVTRHDPSEGYSLYVQWRPVLNAIYSISGILMMPAVWVYQLFKWAIPASINWFPTLESARLLEVMASQKELAPIHSTLATPEAKKFFIGHFQFLLPVAMILYKLLSPVLDTVGDFLKNLIWNILIEFSFTKKKQAVYQQQLEKRAADLMKLKVEYKNLSKEASMLAETVIKDELTGLFNKRYFLQRVDDEFKQAKQRKDLFSIVMIDIDHFKKLNDTYGHLMGDKVLKEVASQIGKNTPSGCYPCRFGGEEFSVIMPCKNQAAAMAIAQAIHGKIPLLRFEEDPNLVVTISMGMLTVDFQKPESNDLQKFDDAIKLADDQLYHAKLNGRNRIEAIEI